MNFRENETDTKLRGGYYTPVDIASFLSRWALNKNAEKVLEPSCGDGVFISAASIARAEGLDLTCVEIDPTEAQKARDRVANTEGFRTEVITADFLRWALIRFNQPPAFDAVIGNPPYIRYQYLQKESQTLAELIFKRFHLPFTKHTNAWVPFVIASIAVLKPGGRIAMVIPSEILHILHAAPLRQLLLSQCETVLLIDPSELLFEEALQGTMLLMAEKRQITSTSRAHVAVLSQSMTGLLSQDPEDIFRHSRYVSGNVLNGKWTKVLLTTDELAVFEKAPQLPAVRRFGDVASVDIGIVTGANKFFLIDDATVNTYGLAQWVHPMFGRSEHCPGVIYDTRVHQENKSKGLPSNFLMLGNAKMADLPASVQDYLKDGERQKLDTRYKCRIRTPWYNVPSVYATRVGMLKRSHNYPRLILNSMEAFTTDTAYRIRPKGVAAEALVYCFVNSLTALSAELEGRHYGGGVLELVPSEIEKLLVPLPQMAYYELERLDQTIREESDAAQLLRAQDERVLPAVGLASHEIALIQQAWQRVHLRRQRLEVAPNDKATTDE